MEKRILHRRVSGFVKYPSDFEKRTIDGRSRYRTKCDMLVGPCACGWVHQEDEEWVQSLLQKNNAIIEPFILLPENGVVEFPSYWPKPVNHSHCMTLHGPCSCGAVHAANEYWVVKLLKKHNAVIVCEEANFPVINEEEQESNELKLDNSGGAIVGCDCETCRRARNSSRRTGRLERTQI